MKALNLIVLLVIIIVYGCKKTEEFGSVNYYIKYQTGIPEQSSYLKSATNPVLYHSQFGSYITSITPNKLTAKFQTIRFYDNKSLDTDGHIIELIDNNLPPNDTLRFADFTGGKTISIQPNLYGRDRMEGAAFTSDVTFSYFSFSLKYFYQEVELPNQYQNICLNQFNHIYNNTNYLCSTVKNGITIKCEDYPFINSLFSAETSGWLSTYIYGGTGSTNIIYPTINQVDPTLLVPFGNQLNNTFVWSKNFSPVTIHVPTEGTTTTIVCTLQFNTENLIQIYAGQDNIAYTDDDILVYPPNYWERLTVTVTEN